jgi:hypothetical protein
MRIVAVASIVALAAIVSCKASEPISIGPEPVDGGIVGTGGAGGASGVAGTGTGGTTAQGGGGGPECADCGFHSGTRLRAMYYQADDGAGYQIGYWFDSERNEQCVFQTAGDGARRCLPVGGGIATGYFSDPGCTQPLAKISSCGPVPKYAWSSTLDNCDTIYRVYPLGSPVSTVYSGKPGQCNLVPSPPDGPYYLIGPEIPPSEFVAATLVQE